MTAARRDDRGRRGDRRWQVSVEWTAYVLPNAAEIEEYTAALDGRLQLPATPAATGYPNTLTADVLVEAATLRTAVTAGLSRVESTVGCTASGVHAVRVPADATSGSTTSR